MFNRTVHYLYEGAKRASVRFYVTLIVLVLLALIWKSPAGHVEAAIHPQPAAATGSVPPEPSTFNSLRNAAASGDDFANRELTAALLDRYDVSGNSDDLYEAVVWIDRRWDDPAKSELAARITAQYCGQRVIRWHWLCASNE
jgi:hypothetical protein